MCVGELKLGVLIELDGASLVGVGRRKGARG